MKKLKQVLIFTAGVFLASLAYFLAIYPNRAEDPEHETFLHEIGEVFGTLGIWALVIIYGRTLVKLAFGQGGLAQRLVPDEYDVSAIPPFKILLNFLNRTHVFVGIVAIAVILLHIAMVGLHADILFFPAVLALVLWQGVFGFFLTWRFSPEDLKKASYVVHAQFLTGIMIGIFSVFGHLLLDD
jgi:preprotein translocase subunit YajC